MDDWFASLLEECRTGDVCRVEKIINRRIPPIAASDLRQMLSRCLLVVVQHGYTRLVDLLILHGADPSADNNAAIDHAIQTNHLVMTKLLLSYASTNPDVTNFSLVCKRRQIKMIRLLLNDGRIDAGKDCSRCLRDAANAGDLEVVSLLMDDPRVDPSANHDEAVWNAVAHEDWQMVRMLRRDPRVKCKAGEPLGTL